MKCRVLLFILVLSFGKYVNPNGTPDEDDLCAPSDLEVANLNPHDVLLGWKFKKTTGCSTKRGVKFSIVYETSTESSAPLIASGEEPLRFKLSGLNPGTMYSVKIQAVAGKAVSNETVGSFRTLVEEWPTPEIEVSEVRVADQAGLSLRWDVIRDESLSEFEMGVCTSNCTNRTLESSERVANLFLNYHTSYSVQICAIFIQPLGETIRKSSSVIRGVSPVGAPDGPIEMTKTTQRENLLELAWDPPEKPNGPLDRYDLVVSDTIQRSSRKRLKVSGTEASIELPPLSGYEFTVEIRAVNVDPETAEEFIGEWTEYSFIRTLPDEPQGIEVVERKTDSLKLKVIPSSNSSSLRYHLTTDERNSGRVKEEYVASETEVLGLKIFQNVTIYASACYSDTSHKFTCGESLSKTTTSNVAAPSVVRDLSVTSSWKGLVVSWEEPILFNGPVDGYMVFINASDESELSNSSISSSSRNYTFDRVNSEKSYEFSVAAFNIDLQTGKKLLGERSNARTINKYSVWLAVLMPIGIVVGLAGAAIIVHFLVTSRNKSDAFPPVTVTFTREERSDRLERSE